MDDTSLLSSSSSEDGHKHKRHRKTLNHDKRHKRKHRSKHHKDDLINLPPAQSDWEALKKAFQFVLPDEENLSSSPTAAGTKKSSTWKDRMVQHYHSHLYKEFVLADLSRVLEIGKIGLRWRTEGEVKSGQGFRNCGNLKCESARINSDSKKEAYDSAVRRSVGIAVPENGGKEPLGVLLPHASSSEAGEALDMYLKSCIINAKERKCDKMTSDDEGSDSYEDRCSRKRQKKSKQMAKKKTKNLHRKHSRISSLQDEEREEQKRLALVPHGVGLYDYEVDFAYLEQNVNKRELVKVRLCLRCAPLLFAAKDNFTNKNQENEVGPAVKARNVRLMAIERTATNAKNAKLC